MPYLPSCFFLLCLLLFKSTQAFVGVSSPVGTAWKFNSSLAGRTNSAAALQRPCCTDGFVIRLHATATASVDTVVVINEEDTDLDLAPTNGLFKRDCYIATNRFAVRPDRAAAFEKRWATRKSRLAVLPGFRHFHLMRRVKRVDDGSFRYDGGEQSNEAAQENYISFTIWDKKSDFSAWRKGDAFKEAHGGTSIVSFLSTMVNSALILRGAPRPAFYDGLCLQYQKPTYLPDPVDGWRSVPADGVNTLPAECFVQMIKYFVPYDQARAFETSWKESNEQNTQSNSAAVIASSLMRRDGRAKGHGVTPMDASEPTYVATTIFANQRDYDEYNKQKKLAVDAPLGGARWAKAPETVFYEGTLMLSAP